MRASPILAVAVGLLALALPACHESHAEEHVHHEHHKIVVTTPQVKDVVTTQQYVCQIRSQRYIEVCAMANGFLMAVPIKEGQAVKKGDVMFQVVPTLYKARLEAEVAELQLAQIEFDSTNKLFNDKTPVVSSREVALYQAKLAKAQANANKAEAELNFATIRAPFDGIVDRLLKQQGSKIKEEDALTTLSDNSVMWAYFNVPECRYLEYAGGGVGDGQQTPTVELALANGSKFPQACKSVTPMGKLNNETGNFSYRADFPNPDRQLRHGQTGNVLLHRTLKDAIVIPQRATFETLDRRYVFVVGKDDVVRQREVVIQNEMDDIFVVKSGLDATDRIVLDGVRQVHDGEKVHYEMVKPDAVAGSQKHHAE